MKILTVAIPSYNSEAYMKIAIASAAAGGDDVEVLVIDDGSKDGTYEVAKECEKLYPGIVRAIHQENKGHGGAVNTGLANATGMYFKVCDSDDRFDHDAYMKVLQALRECVKTGNTPDALISNYVYDKQDAKKKKEMHYTGCFPEGRVFKWNEMMKPLSTTRYILMHSLMYKTELLRGFGFALPEHCFYVDNIFAFTPLAYVKTLYYVNAPLYQYFIGRADQSVNESVMLTRMDQQIRVTRLMIDGFRPELVRKKQQAETMVHYLSIIMTVTTVLLYRKGDEESIKEKEAIWEYLKAKDEKVYLQIRKGPLGRAMNLPGKAGRYLAVKGYKITNKIFGFN